MHELRNALGYRNLPTRDPIEAELRGRWYEARQVWLDEGAPDSGSSLYAFTHVDDQLTKHLWNRCEADIAADRARHPKAKRNQPVPQRDPADAPTRCLP